MVVEKPASKETPKSDSVEMSDFELFCAFLSGNWNYNTVAAHIQIMSQQPLVFPSPLLWRLPSGIDLPRLVLTVLQDKEFLTQMWPTIEMMLHEAMRNWVWLAHATTSLAVYTVLETLPHLGQLPKKT